MFASAFADDTTEIENTQVNDNADVLSLLRLDTGDAGNATLATAAMGNALEVDVNEAHDVSNDQTFSGNVRAEAETSLHHIDGTAITAASATGNAAYLDFEDDSDIVSTQTAADGSTVSAAATLNVASYAMSSITASQAAANAVEINAETASIQGDFVQDSGADVTATTILNAPTGGLGWTAAGAAAAVGNNIQTTGFDADQILDVDQTNRGRIRADMQVEAGGGSEFMTVAAQAQGNGVDLNNQWGYAHIQGQQTNDGEVEANTNVVISDFDIDSIIVSSEGIGNSALLSNQGADTYMGVTQANNANVRATTRFEGGVGGEVTGSAAAYGNAATSYVCSNCPGVEARGNVNQTNSGNVTSTFQTTYQSGWGVMGSATAVGNSATFVSERPGESD